MNVWSVHSEAVYTEMCTDMNQLFLVLILFLIWMTPKRKQISGNEHVKGKDLFKTVFLWNERIQYTCKTICSEYQVY